MAVSVVVGMVVVVVAVVAEELVVSASIAVLDAGDELVGVVSDVGVADEVAEAVIAAEDATGEAGLFVVCPSDREGEEGAPCDAFATIEA